MLTPLILTPAEAAAAIGAKCGGQSPLADDPTMLEILRGATSRLEVAMNVASLSKGTYLNRFYLKPQDHLRRATVLLTHGYLSGVDDFTFLNEDGDAVTSDQLTLPAQMDIDNILGTVEFRSWKPGYYSLEFTAGLPFDNIGQTEDRLFDVEKTPEWMRACVVLYMVSWFRAIYLSPRTPKDYSLAQLMDRLDRELIARVYGKYMRPRQGMVFADQR